jgi:hypothetical protein
MEYTFYKIQVGNECYVGSTKDFKKRMSTHKYSCHHDKDTNYNYKVYKSIREVGWDNINFMIIDKIIYDYKNEALDMETKYITMFDAKLNSQIPNRSREQYRIDNRENKKVQGKIYYEKNKDVLNERTKEYYEENKEHLRQKQKEWNTINRESMLQKQREYREKNKEKTKEKGCCDICGVDMTKRSIPRHKVRKH